MSNYFLISGRVGQYIDKMILKCLITNVEILGFTAAMLGTVSLVPQVIKTITLNSTN